MTFISDLLPQFRFLTNTDLWSSMLLSPNVKSIFEREVCSFIILIRVIVYIFSWCATIFVLLRNGPHFQEIFVLPMLAPNAQVEIKACTLKTYKKKKIGQVHERSSSLFLFYKKIKYLCVSLLRIYKMIAETCPFLYTISHNILDCNPIYGEPTA